MTRENFRLGKSKFAGRGILANRFMQRGEIICQFRGAKITFQQMCEKFSRPQFDVTREYDNALQISPELYLDLSEPFGYFNHSCSPNAGMRNDGILFALQDIQPDEEIAFDYSTTACDPLWRMPCACGAECCRRTIGDFLTLPHKCREFYREQGALMRHLIETFY